MASKKDTRRGQNSPTCTNPATKEISSLFLAARSFTPRWIRLVFLFCLRWLWISSLPSFFLCHTMSAGPALWATYQKLFLMSYSADTPPSRGPKRKASSVSGSRATAIALLHCGMELTWAGIVQMCSRVWKWPSKVSVPCFLSPHMALSLHTR